MTTFELLKEIESELELARTRIVSHDEAAAVQSEATDDGKSTTVRALEALQRPERFAGEHDVARAWLREHSTLSMAQLYLRRRA